MVRFAAPAEENKQSTNSTPQQKNSRAAFASPAFLSSAGSLQDSSDDALASISFDGVEAENADRLFGGDAGNETLELSEIMESTPAQTPLHLDPPVLPSFSSLPRALGLSAARLQLFSDSLHNDESKNINNSSSASPITHSHSHSQSHSHLHSPFSLHRPNRDFPSLPQTALPLSPPTFRASNFPPFDRDFQTSEVSPDVFDSALGRSGGQFRSFRAAFGPGGLIAFPVLDRSLSIIRLPVAIESVAESNDRLEFVENSLNSHLSLHSDRGNRKPTVRELCENYSNSMTKFMQTIPLNPQEQFGLHLSASSQLNSHEFPYSIYTQIQHFISVFQLTRGLFSENPGSTPNSYAEHSARTFALTKWIESTVAKEIQHEIPALTAVGAIYSLISGHQIPSAVDRSISLGNFRLATLISQLGQNNELIRDFSEQIKIWQNNGTWDTLSEEYRAIYRTMAGDPNVEPNLNWIRGFGSHLWFAEPAGNKSIGQAVKSFLEAVKHKLASEPLPPYPVEPNHNNNSRGHGIDDDSMEQEFEPADSELRDTRFELLAIQSGVSDNYSSLYSPLSSTPFPLDYTLSFHLFETLRLTSLPIYPRVHEIYMNFVAELELLGLWHWGIYVVMNSEKLEQNLEPGLGRLHWERKKIVKEILNRHIQHVEQRTDEISVKATAEGIRVNWSEISKSNSNSAAALIDSASDSSSGLSESFQSRLAVQPAIEEFLVRRIGVPREWIEEAKAISAFNDFRFGAARRHFVAAQLWGAAYAVAVEKIIPLLILLDKQNEAESILKELNAHSNQIAGWIDGGEFYLNYFELEKNSNQLIDQIESKPDQKKQFDIRTAISLKESLANFSVRVDSRARNLQSRMNHSDDFAVVELANLQKMNGEIIKFQRAINIEKVDILSMADEGGADYQSRLSAVSFPNLRVPSCLRGSDRMAALDLLTSSLIQQFDS